MGLMLFMSRTMTLALMLVKVPGQSLPISDTGSTVQDSSSRLYILSTSFYICNRFSQPRCFAKSLVRRNHDDGIDLGHFRSGRKKEISRKCRRYE
jgi:hypothetical protein